MAMSGISKMMRPKWVGSNKRRP